MIRDKYTKELYLIPAAQTRDKSAVQPEQMQELCHQLREDFEYILIDCPAGIEQGSRLPSQPQTMLSSLPHPKFRLSGMPTG